MELVDGVELVEDVDLMEGVERMEEVRNRSRKEATNAFTIFYISYVLLLIHTYQLSKSHQDRSKH